MVATVLACAWLLTTAHDEGRSNTPTAPSGRNTLLSPTDPGMPCQAKIMVYAHLSRLFKAPAVAAVHVVAAVGKTLPPRTSVQDALAGARRRVPWYHRCQSCWALLCSGTVVVHPIEQHNIPCCTDCSQTHQTARGALWCNLDASIVQCPDKVGVVKAQTAGQEKRGC